MGKKNQLPAANVMLENAYLWHPHIAEKYTFNSGKECYSLMVLFDDSDKKNMETLKKAMISLTGDSNEERIKERLQFRDTSSYMQNTNGFAARSKYPLLILDQKKNILKDVKDIERRFTFGSVINVYMKLQRNITDGKESIAKIPLAIQLVKEAPSNIGCYGMFNILTLGSVL